MNVLVILMAVAVLSVVATKLRAADPARSRVAPLQWYVWTAGHVTLAAGMVAVVAAVLTPNCAGAEKSYVLILSGVVALLAVSRHRRAQ